MVYLLTRFTLNKSFSPSPPPSPALHALTNFPLFNFLPSYSQSSPSLPSHPSMDMMEQALHFEDKELLSVDLLSSDYGSMGFLQLLSLQHPISSPPITTTTDITPLVFNTPNPSSSSPTSSLNEHHHHHHHTSDTRMKKAKKMKQTKGEEQRFAFMTKSEVDLLEDGYRWRKYGQKAVKSSSFPRSYYRCTGVACGVKKRVERCFDDPSMVVTTYEGKHTHPSPFSLRPAPAVTTSALPISSEPFLYSHQPPPLLPLSAYTNTTAFDLPRLDYYHHHHASSFPMIADYGFV